MFDEAAAAASDLLFAAVGQAVLRELRPHDGQAVL